MDKISLGSSGIHIPRICFGCGPMGVYDYGSVNKSEVIDAAREAVNLGIGFFDTADVYGLGVSEINLGQALEGIRDRAVIATKFGVRKDSNGKTFFDNSPEWIRVAIRESLKRLQTDRIDLYQLHYPDGVTPLEEVFNTLEELCSDGLIRAYGVSNLIKIPEIDRSRYSAFVSFQNEYSLVNRLLENEIERITKREGYTFLSYGSLGQGILSGRYKEETKFGANDRRVRPEYINFHGEKLAKNLEIIKDIKEIADKRSVSPAQVSVRWIIDRFKRSVPIVGIKSVTQLLDLSSVMEWSLSSEEYNRLDSITSQPNSAYEAI